MSTNPPESPDSSVPQPSQPDQSGPLDDGKYDGEDGA